MRIHLMSDLHMEHYRDAGKQSFYEHLREHSVKDFPEVVVLAGDIAIPNQIEDVLYAFSRLYSQSTILFVPGNHDYAGSSPTECHRIFRGIDLPNVRWLDNEVTEVQGVRFFGGTLWYDVPTGDAALIRSRFYDFRVIREFTPWVFEQHERFSTALDAAVAEAPVDVVISHHVPSERVISPRWAGSIANHFFCSDMTELMTYWKPRAWLFGHTHDQVDQMVGAARLVCHPRGYPDEFPGQADRDVSRYLPKVIEI